MNDRQHARRAFLRSSAGLLAGALGGVSFPLLLRLGESAAAARDQEEGLRVLAAEEAADLDAIAAQIIPSGDGPGAREAGVVYFMDAAMAGMFEGMLPSLRAGLAALNAKTGTEGLRFAGLSWEAQTALLTTEQDTDFFGTVRFLTLAGMFSMPAHGGNRDRLGWQLIGFEPRHAWAPPFGYYDAQVPEGDST